ncbi:hypothetical protein PCASD_04421 [Puccinia coronata f. sp. avenae]|uniref:Uncharacterized protein n=1 Tax=Puccinia coronata f. sp. avenae TaxID=200324 RepID=A0A2N5VBS5_9BASI|nr:hypothetical protein PCASD_04421 [Puccinia coronata f. sp. avenae]
MRVDVWMFKVYTLASSCVFQLVSGMGDDPTGGRYLRDFEIGRATGSKTGPNEINSDLQLERSSGKRIYREMEPHGDSKKATRTTVELEKTVKCGCNPWHFAGGFAPKRESNTDALERIWRCHSEAVTNLHRWKSDILKHFTGQGRHDDGLQSNTISESQQFRPHQLLIQQVESLIRQVTHLFEHKFYQLSIKLDVHDPSSRRKLEESFRKVLTSISEIQIQGPSEDMHNLWERFYLNHPFSHTSSTKKLVANSSGNISILDPFVLLTPSISTSTPNLACKKTLQRRNSEILLNF